jgi:hypothetical protein
MESEMLELEITVSHNLDMVDFLGRRSHIGSALLLSLSLPSVAGCFIVSMACIVWMKLPTASKRRGHTVHNVLRFHSPAKERNESCKFWSAPLSIPWMQSVDCLQYLVYCRGVE